jgi:predicted MPP superfamily phosphohydrolase
MSEAQGSLDSNTETPSRTVAMRARGWSRFLIAALALHIPLFFYPILRLCGWLELPVWLTALVFIPLGSSQIVSRMFLRHNISQWARWARLASDFWLGISPLVLIALLVFEVLVLAGVVATDIAGLSVISIGILCGIAGLIVAIVPMVKKIEFSSPKLNKPVRFVQITDVHIGSRSQSFLEKVVRKINQLEPDFVCITGDFIDATGVTEAELNSLKSISGPVYFSIGNHEKYEDLDEILKRMFNLGVKSLRNDQTQFRDDIQVIGIDDMDDAMQVKRQLQDIVISDDAFVVLMYHRPRGLEAAADAGIDLMLSGHTHNGQIFPFNFVVSSVFDKVKGMYKNGNSRLYVSQGTGTWGPVMRIGTRSEITLFEITPEE